MDDIGLNYNLYYKQVLWKMYHVIRHTDVSYTDTTLITEPSNINNIPLYIIMICH